MKSCQDCGKQVTRYHRVYLGTGYCQTCYQREFKPKPCARCNKIHRLPRKMEDAVCDSCRKKQPCIRCGKQEYAIGKITSYGPVCAACAVYFRQKTACDFCGKLTARLSHLDKAGTSFKVCNNCHNAAKGHATCPRCHKYRLLAETAQGRICKKCAEDGFILCSVCHQPAAAGQGSVCSDCRWAETLAHRTRFLSVTIQSGSEWRTAFERFALWLGQDIGHAKAAMTLKRYAPFFCEAAKQWHQIPDYNVILGHFKPKGMRKCLKVKEWLENTLSGSVSEALVTELVERDRIQALLEKLASNQYADKLIQPYYQELLQRHHDKRIGLKTVRLALQPAVGLLQTVCAVLTQDDVNSYLKHKPGQANALSGFLNHLKRHEGMQLVAQANRQKAKAMKDDPLERKLIAYVTQCREEPDGFKRQQWLKLAMPYFYKRPLPKSCTVQELGDRFRLTSQDGSVYFLPHPLHPAK